MEPLVINDQVTLSELRKFIFEGPGGQTLSFPKEWEKNVADSHRAFLTRLDRNEPIYGVTTGFGDSNYRRIDPGKSQQLQENLIRYLTCGGGPLLSKPARRATCLFRLLSLARGYSGVSPELIQHLSTLVEADWLPLIPAEGSLGASGDLIPLAYLAGALQGWGEIETPEGVKDAASVFAQFGKKPYRLQAKEGLAIVNGTSAMAGQAFVNVTYAKRLNLLSVLETAWLCIAVRGKTESFNTLVNEKAKQFPGHLPARLPMREQGLGNAARTHGQQGSVTGGVPQKSSQCGQFARA